MEYVGPVAHSVGYSLEDTASAIGLLSNNGIEAEKAGTALRGAISRMLKPTQQSAVAFKEMGLSTDKMKKGFYSLPDLIDTINKNTQGMTKAQKAHLITQAFGVEAQTGMNVLLSQGGDALRDLSKETKNATGYTKDLADQMGNSAQQKVNRLKASFQVLEQEIGQELVPEITPLIEDVTHLIKEFGDLDESQKQNIIHIALFAAGIGPASLVLGGLTKSVRLLTGGLGKGLTALNKYSKATKVMGTVSKVEAAGGIAAAAGEAGALTGVLGLLTNPVTLTVAGLGAVGFAGYEVYKHLKKTNKSMDELQKVSFDTAESLMKQHDSNAKLIDSFDQLRAKSHLTNDEFGRYLDIQTKINRESDPQVLARLRDEQEKLRKKSGLTNDQLDRMVDLNSTLTKKLPLSTDKITEQGNRVAGTTSSLQKYNEELAKASTRDLEIEYQKTLSNEPKLLAKKAELQSQINAGRKQETELLKLAQNYNKTAVNDAIKKYENELLQLNTQSWHNYQLGITDKSLDKQIKQDQKILKALKGGKQTLVDQLDTLNKQNNTLNDQIAKTNTDLKKKDEAKKKLQEQLLVESGISSKKADQLVKDGKSVSYINSSISKLKKQKEKLDEMVPPNKRNSDLYKNQVSSINNQISKLQHARTEIKGMNKDGEKTNKTLGKTINKKVKITVSPKPYTVDDQLKKDVFKTVHVTYQEQSYLMGNTRGHNALIGANASGTDNWRGGLTWVGEKGPELIDLPKGTKIYDNQKSVAMMASLTDQSRSIQAMNQFLGSQSVSPSTERVMLDNSKLEQLQAQNNQLVSLLIQTLQNKQFNISEKQVYDANKNYSDQLQARLKTARGR
ncbi:hypothetical protein JOD43_002113 [Pullulanibacillus pueri]|uniref:Phage tail tape measure protein domain-containing protein n=1 Tax=Pullulanibacillus pueri TaxID=1437324 RepID=A0A8J2ZWH8_9BACL|nr:phage tail tape measure protein [Pullulanibacillus pueri]MBM7681941.1 hypothetical protein [Pullulanibacillus pueri]GGH83532.1 hypothetical protein GCM10007096_24540 [Pullulanibacillus pueri]